MRKLLKVEVDNILSTRKFRNNFEHYDEQLEKWFKNRPYGVYVDLAMNPSLGGFVANEHSGYNSFDNSLIFRGERLDLNEVLTALTAINKNCKLYVLDFI